MDITKCNEVFEINGTTDRYIVNGIADRDLSRHLNIDFRFSNLDDIELGNGWYNEYLENNYSDFGLVALMKIVPNLLNSQMKRLIL